MLQKMAEQGRTVRVSGLPADIEDNRLKDKLLIHFLRSRNGGGEIESVTIEEATPVCALITFEESGVAQRVIQHGRHILEMGGKRHKVIVTEHQESLDPDKVIPSLSADVNCSQLPGGVSALRSLHKSHPDIQINHATEDVCTLQGAYSKVQAALAQLLGHPGGLECAKTDDTGQPTISGSTSAQKVQKPESDESDQRRKPSKESQQKEKDHSRRVMEDRPSSFWHLTPGGFGWEDTGQTEGAASQPPEEDFSLIVDADMFQYLQRHCLKEYQKILSQYGVDVVDVTNQGLTTLFLKVASEEQEDGRGVERMKLAKRSLSQLYQDNEARIRRAQLPKNILTPKGGLQRAMENLSIRLPKLLLNEDEKNVYIIGSSSDVSEAKQFLLLDHGEEKEDVASLLRYPPNDSGAASCADKRESTFISSDVDPDRMNQLLRSEEDERREEGARRYKLAARFKDSGLAALGNRPTDFSVRGLSSPKKQAQTGTTLGSDVLSGTADILGAALAPVRSKTPSNSHLSLTDTRPKSVTDPFSAARSGSSLKRASSFSGTPQQKAQIMGQKSQDDSVKMRSRSSSFSNQTGGHKQEAYTAEMTVPSVMWKHIKTAYNTRVEDLTSDVQVKESGTKTGSDLTVTIRGATPSKVSACQQGLQRLVDSVSMDFSVQELALSELGITDRADENLQACCAEVRSQYKKVTIMVLKNSLFLLGPQKLCFQIGAVLREVFSGVSAPNPEQFDLSGPSDSSFLRTNEENGADVQGFGDSRVMPESGTSQSDGTGRSQERRKQHGGDSLETDLMNGSVSPSLGRKNPVFKEKVKIVGSNSSVGRVNGDVGIGEGFAPLQKETTNPQKNQTELPESAEGGRGAELAAPGILGKMKSSRVPIKIPGQRKDSAIKITYNIPDGIQGEGHPCPGKPFKGGVFEAFFPDSDETRRLLPRLDQAFRKGLTFTVMKRETGAEVIWDGIPHKTTVQGGKSG
ncbi:uncharacterized protein LOC141809439 isoform X2 [Halichoeres trimaculatus]|uniref:uncharacterized protein LOC141809439 isoform X2 n=1 Tax=Halichoeres trimaculatus TaxID=147232 RepID=UPI003D9ED4EC